MNAEERARLRAIVDLSEKRQHTTVTIGTVRLGALLGEVDRLTEALHATDEQIEELVAIEAAHKRCKADLADEKRRHAELRARVEALADHLRVEGVFTRRDTLRRVENLLSDTTTGGEDRG